MSDVQRELEHLRKLATASPEKRFNKLYKLVCQEEMLLLAWQGIRGNKGSRTPGIDGETRDHVDETVILKLSQALRMGSYTPKPLRREYIPKKNGKWRPLGIPTIQDRLVQKAVAMILEVLYEPNFCACSHGFRPQRSTASALRHVAYSYRAGTDWVIEGDIKSCFDAIPHQVILNTLRKRIRDERFLALIAKFLKAGVMEEGQFSPTYSGTPQGGIVSPLLANVVLHEFDLWMEQAHQANPPRESPQAYSQRQTPEYKQLTSKIKQLRGYLKKGEPFPRQRTAADLKAELKRLETARRHTLPSQRRRTVRYVRYADDFVVMLTAHTQAEAESLKAQIRDWLKETLGLTLSEEKTLITHVSEKIRFLGYDIQGMQNPNGTRWARLSIPDEKFRAIVEKLKQATRYRHAPELDVMTNVNVILRGWSNYYRFANDSKTCFSKLTGVAFWLMAHYLGRKHNLSVKQIMGRAYWRDPQTGKMALSTCHPNGNRVFLWNKYPPHVSILVAGGQTSDRQPYLSTMWADGHSIEKKAQLVVAAQGKCEHCGAEGATLIGHHPNRLAKAGRRSASRAASGYEQRGKLLCRDCHYLYHKAETA